MSNEEIINELKNRYLNMSMCLDTESCKKSNEALNIAIKTIQENERLKMESRQGKIFINYFDELYGQGLEVANWHQNGDTESLDNFIDSAHEEAEKALAEMESGNETD